MIEDMLILYKKARAAQKEIPYDIKYPGKNISCGDEITFFIKLKGSIIEDISYTSKGCAVSTSFAYLFSQKAKGKSVSEIKELSDEAYFELIGKKISPGRIKCALLPLVTLKRALKLYLLDVT